MDSPPFIAKVFQMLHQVSRNQLDLTLGETNVAHQLHLPNVTQQLEARMSLYADDMDVGWAMVVWINDHPPTLERWHN